MAKKNKKKKRIITPIKQISGRGINRRLDIVIYKDSEGKHSFRIITKRLIDFKTRNIVETDTWYSVETIKLIHDFLNVMFNDPEISNKILLKEINDIVKWSASTNINQP